MKKIDLLILLFFIITSVFTLKDLFKQGFYTSHDGIHNIVRFYYYDQLLKDGQIPPRWASGLLNGYGYPLFIFSYHTPWFIAEILHSTGLSIIDSVKMTFLVGFILSGITMYFFLKIMFGRLPAYIGSFIYLYAPYRFSNILVRAAIGDATIFVFLPLIFLSLYKLKEKKDIDWRWILIGAISFALSLLSHAMVFLFAFFVIILSIIHYYLISKNIYFLRSSIILTVSGFSLSSFYLIPSIIERNYTKFNEIMGNAFVGNTFLNLKQLIYSPWGYGMMRAVEGGMSFQLGFVQWLVLLLSILLIIFLAIKRRQIADNKIKDAVFYILVFTVSIFLMLPPSIFIWRVISKIAVIDFTWRVLVIPVFSSAVLAGFLIYSIKGKTVKTIMALFIIILAIYTNRNHTRINQSLDWPLTFLLELEKTTNSFDEYTPKWVNNGYIKDKRDKIEVNNFTSKVNILSQKSNLLKFSLENTVREKVVINTVYYPGWKVYINDKLIETKPSANGVMEFEVGAGLNNILLKFAETNLRKVSNLISLMTFILLIGLTQKKRHQKTS